MSIEKLGKKGGPAVTANGVPVLPGIGVGDTRKNPPPGFDLTKLVERAQEVAADRAKEK